MGRSERKCSIEGCRAKWTWKEGGSSTLCPMHYARDRRNSPNAKVPGEIEARDTAIITFRPEKTLKTKIEKAMKKRKAKSLGSFVETCVMYALENMP